MYDDRTKIAMHTLYAGVLLDRHWDAIKELLPNEIRHELGGELGKIRLLRDIVGRKLDKEEVDGNAHNDHR